MTPTETWLARTRELAGDIASHAVSLVTDPSERTYWLGLAVAVAIALGIGVLRRVRVWEARQWVGPSARVDYGLILTKPIIAAVFVVPFTVTTMGVALAVMGLLRDLVGSPPEMLEGWSPAAIAVLYTAVLFVAWDFSRFALHWLLHRVDGLWQFHQVHHSAETLTPFTLYRAHPVESALYQLRGIVVTGVLTGVFAFSFQGRAVELQLLGINACGLVFSLVSGNLRHSHVWWSFGPRLERWLISPAQHQMHHGSAPRDSESNYGTWLAVWDRWAGTLRTASVAPERFGLPPEERNHDPHRLLSALIDPVWAVVALVLRRARGRAGATVAIVVGSSALASTASAASAPPPEDTTAPVEAPQGPTPSPESPPVDAPDTPEPPSGTDPRVAPPPDAVSPSEPETPPADAAPSEPQPEPPANAAPTQPPTEAEEDEVDVDLSDMGSEDEVDVDLSDFGEEQAAEPGPGLEGTDEPSVPPPELPEDVDVATPTVSIIGDAEELPRVVGSAHRVDQETLEREEYDDIHRVLRSVPGVYVRGEDGYGLRPNIGLRGVDPNRSAKITLMEDGVLLGPAPYAAPAAYYFPLTTRLVGVEVYKGPAAIRHGPNTVGGAINLETRDIPRKLETGIDVAAGTWGYGKVHGYAGHSWKRFGILAEAARVQTRGFKELDGGGNTGFGKNEAMLKARAHGDPGARVYHQFDVKLGFSTERSNETYLGITQEDFEDHPYRRYRASEKDRMKWWRSQAEATYFLASGIVEFQTTAYRHDFSRAWRKFNSFRGGPDPYTLFLQPDAAQSQIFLSIMKGEEDSFGTDQTLLIGTNDRRYVSQGLQNTLRISPQTKYVDQVIEVGARVHDDTIRRNHTEDGFLMLSGELVPEGSDTATTTLNRGTAIAGAFHAVDEIRIVDRFTVSPGARVEVIHTRFEDDLAEVETDANQVVFLPGIGLHVQATSWLGVLAGVHRGFSPVAPGQPDEVKPETSINYELGARALWKGLHGEAIAFFNDYSNLTGECTFAQGCEDENIGQQFNGGEVQVAGVEALAGYEHEFSRGGWLDVTGTYTFTWAEFRSSFTSSNPSWGEVEEGDALPYLPNHVASLQLAGGMRRWGANATLQYTGEMRDIPGTGDIPRNVRIDRFFTLDLGGHFFITPRASIYATIQNTTASHYIVARRPFGVRPGRRFSTIVGFKYTFG